MSDQYYVDLSGHTAGPFTAEQLRELYSAGTIDDQTLFSKPGAVEWLPIQIIMPILAACTANAPTPSPPAFPPSIPGPVKPRARRKDYVCALCGYLGRPKLEAKGSFAVELVLWLLFCAPGLIYSIWRVSGRRKICPKCSAQSIIPASSPRGRQLVDVN